MINQKGQGWGCVLWVTKKAWKEKMKNNHLNPQSSVPTGASTQELRRIPASTPMPHHKEAGTAWGHVPMLWCLP